jgi:serine protease Do
MIAVCLTTVPAIGLCQEPPARPSNATLDDSQQVVSRLPANMLVLLSGSLQELANKVSPAVVQIEVTGIGPAEDSDRNDHSDTALIVRQHAIGAGVIVDPDGYIMTNAHVLEGAQRIRVVLPMTPAILSDVSAVRKTRVLNAKIIGTQKEADLALLKVEASNLPTLHFRSDRPARPGELVFAIGSPGGLQNSVTMGVISSAWRQPDPDNPMIYLQTDAPLNPGNSGGPLVDVTGAVVGLNTFILSAGGGSEGLGFAVPARIVNFVYESLRKYGHVHRIEIGVVAQTITPTMAEGLGLAQDWGVVVADVAPGGPAGAVGIEPGDIIVAVDGHPITNLSMFAAALYQHSTDQALKIDELRGTRKLSFCVGAVLARDRIDQLADAANPTKSRIERLGILGVDLDEELRSLLPDLRISRGVVVVGQAPGFNSVETGLRAGDVIHYLNRAPIKSLEQLQSAVAQLKPGDSAALWIERQGRFQYVAFEME